MAGVGDAIMQGGPVADRIAIWPIEDGSYGVDATFQGASGFERAEKHELFLKQAATRLRRDPWWRFLQEPGGKWTLRFGPLTRSEVSAILEAFVS